MTRLSFILLEELSDTLFCQLYHHVGILRRIDTGLVTVELEHSKTKHKRWSDCLGTTLGTAKLPLAQVLRDYWAESRMKVVTCVEGPPWRALPCWV